MNFSYFRVELQTPPHHEYATNFLVISTNALHKTFSLTSLYYYNTVPFADNRFTRHSSMYGPKWLGRAE